MLIVVDFDGTVVQEDHRYDDVETPLQFVDGAREALHALRHAGHNLMLYSGRASRALLYDPRLNPWVRAGVTQLPPEHTWQEARELNLARYRQMVEFCERELPGVFDVIDDGTVGKPNADLFIDNRALRLGVAGIGAVNWHLIAIEYGEPETPSPFAAGKEA